MYASVRRYHVDPRHMDELLRLVPGAVDVISSLSGFRAYYVVKGGEDSIATVSLFKDEAGAVQSNEKAASWVRENAADLELGSVETVTGEVVAYR